MDSPNAIGETRHSPPIGVVLEYETTMTGPKRKVGFCARLRADVLAGNSSNFERKLKIDTLRGRSRGQDPITIQLLNDKGASAVGARRRRAILLLDENRNGWPESGLFAPIAIYTR
jgi:hypothetical protein